MRAARQIFARPKPARGRTKNYLVGEIVIPALRGVSFEIAAASFVSFIGPSGSGKTTLLNLIGCLDKPTTRI